VTLIAKADLFDASTARYLLTVMPPSAEALSSSTSTRILWAAVYAVWHPVSAVYINN